MKSLEKPWFECAKADMGEKCARIITTLKSEQSGRRSRYTKNLELFEGRKMVGYSAHTYSNYNQTDLNAENSFDEDRLLLIRSAVCSAVAEVFGRQKPKPQFQTLGATWAVRRKAYKLDRICEGVLNQRQGEFINAWAFFEDVSVDVALHGCGVFKVVTDELSKRITLKLRPIPDIWFDPVEGRSPRNLYEREPIDENIALKRWPSAKGAIAGAPAYDWNGTGSKRHRVSRCIELNHCYHLPDGPDHPGKWVALIGGVVVDSGDWTAPAFPHVFWFWERHRDGPWGTGIADEGKRNAMECGELDFRLIKRMQIASGARTYYNPEFVTKEDLEGNDERTNIPVTGPQLPVDTVLVPFSELELGFRQQKIQDYWDGLGLSQVSAAARREQNVSSGIGQITLNETKAGRQIQKSKGYEKAVVDCAHQIVWRLRELKEDDPNLVIEFSGGSMIQQIRFDAADPEDAAELRVSVAPASQMSHDPAQRQDTAFMLYQMGMISQEQYKELLGWADIESTMGYDTAAQDFFDALIDKYLDAEEATWTKYQYRAPEGTIPNKLSVLTKFTNAMYRARLDQLTLPDEEAEKAEFNIQLLTRFIRELVALMKPPPAPAQPGMPAGAAPGGPGVPAAAQNAPPGAMPQLAAPPKPGPQPMPMQKAG